MVDYSKWDKMKFSSSEDEDDESNMDENTSKTNGKWNDLIQAVSDKASWSSNLSEKERYEWFVDCYRMRVDDDYAWGGGYLHGLYDQDPIYGKKMTVVKDFLIFMKLAVKNEVISPCFSFGEYLKEAALLLPYAFEKSDAQDKWGGENVFSSRPSLRRTAEHVYGTSCMSDSGPEEAVTLYKNIETAVENGVKNKFQNSNKKLFEDVGDLDVWFKLYRTLIFLH